MTNGHQASCDFPKHPPVTQKVKGLCSQTAYISQPQKITKHGLTLEVHNSGVQAYCFGTGDPNVSLAGLSSFTVGLVDFIMQLKGVG